MSTHNPHSEAIAYALGGGLGAIHTVAAPRETPNDGGVYILWCAGLPEYVGRSYSICYRLTHGHHAYDPQRHTVITYIVTASRDDALRIERALIKMFRPRLNQALNPDRAVVRKPAKPRWRPPMNCTNRAINWRGPVLDILDEYARRSDRSRSWAANELITTHPKIARLRRQMRDAQ